MNADQICWGIIVILILFLLFALYWEYRDLKQVDQLPYLTELNLEDQRKQLEFGSCYPFLYQVTWRPIFIAAAISTLIIALTFYVFHWPINLAAILLIFVFILVISYIVAQWQNFHIYRTICLRNTNHPDGFPTTLSHEQPK